MDIINDTEPKGKGQHDATATACFYKSIVHVHVQVLCLHLQNSQEYYVCEYDQL